MLFWRWVPLGTADVRSLTGPLTDNVQAFILVLPLFVLPSAIAQSLSLPATKQRLPAASSLQAWLPVSAPLLRTAPANSRR